MTVRWWITASDPEYLAPVHVPHHYLTLPSLSPMMSTTPMSVLPTKWEPGGKQPMWGLSQLLITDIHHTYYKSTNSVSPNHAKDSIGLVFSRRF